MVFVVSLAIITGVLAGLFWYWFFGSWFREYFRLDREYRPINGNGHVNLDTTEESFRFYHVVNLLLLPLSVIGLLFIFESRLLAPFETCRLMLSVSVHRGRPEVVGTSSKRRD